MSQKKGAGDPNYYATKPKFDSRGFWRADGDFPPYEPPAGEPATPAHGEWVKQGTTNRNGRSTHVWVWYPPDDKTSTFGNSKPGSTNYLVARTKPVDSAVKLFADPDYWVHKFAVPRAPVSSYKPQILQYVTPDGIVPVVGTFHCKNWLLVSTQYDTSLNATIPGGLFDAGKVFDYYMKFVGVSPYFTYKDLLFKFDPVKSGKNTIRICTDGMNVQQNPPGSETKYTVYPSGGSGGVLVVHQHGVGQAPSTVREGSMESAFSYNVRGLGRAPQDSAFNPALIRGLGSAPKGLGLMASGAMGTPVLAAIPSGQLPPVETTDWVEFYPNDPDNFQGNTNLGTPSSVPGWSVNRNGGTGNLLNIINQVTNEAPGGPGATVYWLFADPNDWAAWTISTLSGSTFAQSIGAGNGTVAMICSSWRGGKLKLEVALKCVVMPPTSFNGWPDGAVLNGRVNLSNQCGDGKSPLWYQVPSVAASQGFPVALSPAQQNDVLDNYLMFLNQPQFLKGIIPPGGGAGPHGNWIGFGPPTLNAPSSVPDVHFAYRGQLYKISWVGTWTPGQIGGAAGAGPILYVCGNPPQPLKPLPLPPPPPPPPPMKPITVQLPGGVSAQTGPTLPPVAVAPGIIPPGTQTAFQAPVATVTTPTVTAPGPLMPAPAAPPPATTSTIPTAVYVAGAIIAIGVIGGVAYLALE